MAFIEIPESCREKLLTPKTLDLGSYTRWGSESNRQQSFIVEIDAAPLLILFEEAALSYRVYELLTISRIGDVLHYLRIRPIEVEECVAEIFSGKGQRESNRFQETTDVNRWGEGYWPLVDFDRYFVLQDDETPPAIACWRYFWDEGSWLTYVADLLASVRVIQSLLRKCDDYLINLEVTRLDKGLHALDLLPVIDRDCRVVKQIPDNVELPRALFDLIDELITGATVQSVACPFNGFWIWRRLFQEQLKRSSKTNSKPLQAFSLSCADSTQVLAPYTSWGAELHRPYEGYCGADLFIKPKWRNTFPDTDREGGSLADIVFYGGEISPDHRCHYLLTDTDLGELKCATRREVGDGWVLYENNQPYRPNLNFKDDQVFKQF
ncbi:hypothetical protein [Methylomonas koyamae]|uniref:hypothetical protein n=1 Tax=Methylomonas koyamae TaxID=702114 RepID=UPI000BC30E87|nr:hypothetical protein [Methylomonas koyamae]ATG91419.1 hypothetical protein MKLM6_3227 [Methylomonas koyamae]